MTESVARPEYESTRIQHIPIALDERERLSRAIARIAEKRELDAVTEEAKRVANDFKSKIKARELRIDELDEIVESGKEKRAIQCGRRTYPEQGVIKWYRLDTGEEVISEALLPVEADDDQEAPDARQQTLPGVAASPAPAAPKRHTEEGLDSDGIMHELTAEQADTVRATLAGGEGALGQAYCDVRIEGADGVGGKIIRIVALAPCLTCGAADGRHREEAHAAEQSDEDESYRDPEDNGGAPDPVDEDEPAEGDAFDASRACEDCGGLDGQHVDTCISNAYTPPEQEETPKKRNRRARKDG